MLSQGFDNNNSFKGTGTAADIRLNWFGDGQPQFSTVHASAEIGGSTQSNASSTGIAFTEDNYEVADLALQYQRQDNGELLTMGGMRKLCVSADLEREAKIVAMSDKKVGTDFNDVNVYSGGVFDVVASKYLGSRGQIGGADNAWFLLDDMSHKLMFVEREAMTIERDDIGKNRTTQYTIHGRWTVASKGWKGTFGSKGDGQAYSA